MKNKGITLIALVISIIVLLILAGISISMLAGDNSILQRAVESKEATEIGQERESITLAYNSVIIDKITKEEKNITLDEFNKAIKNYYNDVTTASEGSKIIVTFPNGHKYTVYKNGTVEKYTEPPLAKDTLTVTVNEDGTVESPYYVNYPSAKGTIKCRVLYNDDTYGLQIISEEPITKVNLGCNDSNPNVSGEIESLERTQNSYNRAITTLNENAERYIETPDGNILATDARCVGSDPLNKNFPDNTVGDERTTEMYTRTETYMSNFNGKYFKTDTHYATDYNRLEKISATTFSDKTNGIFYWLASRRVYKMSGGDFDFSERLVFYNTLKLNSVTIWGVDTEGNARGGASVEGGLRPVFKLSPEVKILDGEGTEAVPFEIGL